MASHTGDTALRSRQPSRQQVALIVGVGPGLGEAMAQRFARGGMAVVLASRDADRLDGLAEAIARDGGTAFAYWMRCDP